MFLKQKWLNKFALFFILLFISSILHAQEKLSLDLKLKNIDKASVEIILKNTSNKVIKILKWNTPLEERLNANLFLVKYGKQNIPYQGKLLKRAHPTEADYTFFEAGEEQRVTIDLESYYKMTNKGDYTVSYTGNFQIVSELNKKSVLKKIKNIDKILTFSFIPSKIQKFKKNKLSNQFNGCSQSEVDIIKNAHTSATNIAKNASITMKNAYTNTTGERYTTWFGTANKDRQNRVTSHLNNIYDALDNKPLKFDCSTCTEDGVFAFVYPDEEYDVFLCSAFWESKKEGTDSQSGTLIHELSHFISLAGTDDYIYGQDSAKDLAISDPNKAIYNADNYEYFTENTPFLNMKSDNPFESAREIIEFPFSDNIDAPEKENIYKFKATKTAEHAFYTSGNLDTIGKLYDSKFNLLIDVDDNYDGQNFIIFYRLIKGETYYIKINAYQDNVGEYKFSLLTRSLQKNDFNGDTISDILWRKGSGNYLWYMNSNGTHKYKNIGSKPIEYTISSIADFNFDGVSDILWRKGSGNYLWYMNSNGTHKYKNIGSKPQEYKVTAVADFDDNGINDILWRRGSGNYLWYMNSNGTHTYKNIGAKSSSYSVSGVANFNNDLFADILWRKGSGNYLWYMKADGTHTYKNIGSKPVEYKVAGIADFNADGISDILWKKGSGNYLWYMKADGTHTYKNIGAKSSSYTISTIADFNGDGIADILWRKGSGNYLWYMKADGTHTYKNIGGKSSSYIIPKK